MRVHWRTGISITAVAGSLPRRTFLKPIWQRLNIEVLITQFVAWLPSVFAAAIILFLFYLIYRITKPALTGVLHRIGLDTALAGMLLGVYRFAVLAMGVVMAAGQLGINVGAALAGLGVVGLSIGFAAKDSLSNIMAGFLIFWDKPFHVGDWITLGDHYGMVGEVTLRTTRVRTLNNTWIIVPNEKVINEVLINHSAKGSTRLNIPVSIGYKEDIDQARNVLLERIRKVDLVLADPAPRVVVKNLGDSTVDLWILVWIEDAKNEKPVFYRVLEEAKKALDQANIEIPFPQLDLHMPTAVNAK